MTQRLKIRMHGTHVADLEQAPRSGKLSIRYVEGWLNDPAGYAISLRMPLRSRPYDDAFAAPFVAGLLPDSKVHQRMIGQRVGIGDPSPFSLLEAIGRECAGAISVVPVDEDDAPELSVAPQFDLLDEAGLAQMIRDLPRRPLMIDDDGYIRLSLAGVNDKAAVVKAAGQIGLPKGNTPSTHILKPDIPRLPDSARTENFCLKLAREAGIRAARSSIEVAEDQVFLLISRFDRRLIASTPPRLQRVHQEDFCQALGYSPDFKYEDRGGPSWKMSFDLLDQATTNREIIRHRNHSPKARSADRPGLLNLALFQWLSGNPDAHAKNYSLLLEPSSIKLAPAYDLNNSAAFHSEFAKVRPRMAMAIGGEFNPNSLTGAHWDAFAGETGFAPTIVRAALIEMAEKLPDLASSLAHSMRGTAAWSDRIEIVVDDIASRCKGVPEMLTSAEPAASKTADEDVGPSL